MRRVPKRFEEKWAAHPEFETVVIAAWTNAVSMGSPMYNLFEKKKLLRSIGGVGQKYIWELKSIFGRKTYGVGRANGAE